MTRSPSLLCPVDFSEASRAALAHAAAIANHFGAELTVFTAVDPLVAALAASDPTEARLDVETDRALRRFCDDALGDAPSGPRTDRFRQAVGTPATEIRREANDTQADLIVMSSHGHRGIRHALFGSTTERVLRETQVPVLITPENGPKAIPLSELAGQIHEIVAPVDLTDASSRQVTVAAAVARALAVPLIVVHVLPPAGGPLANRWSSASAAAERLERARRRLAEIQSPICTGTPTESLVVSGEPAEEIVKVAESRGAGLIVMGLHSSGMFGPRMGSVTYRVLCATNSFVLALPPHAAAEAAPVEVLKRAFV